MVSRDLRVSSVLPINLHTAADWSSKPDWPTNMQVGSCARIYLELELELSTC